MRRAENCPFGSLNITAFDFGTGRQSPEHGYGLACKLLPSPSLAALPLDSYEVGQCERCVSHLPCNRCQEAIEPRMCSCLVSVCF